MAAYLSAGFSVFLVAALLGRLLFKVQPGEAALQGSAAVLGNTGYMGLSLVAAVFGEAAAIPLVLGLTLEVTLIIPFTIALVEATKGSGGWSRVPSSVTGTLARNPLIVAIFAGALISALGLEDVSEECEAIDTKDDQSQENGSISKAKPRDLREFSWCAQQDSNLRPSDTD